MFILSLLLLFKFVSVCFDNQVISVPFFFVCFQVDVIISEWMVSLIGSFFIYSNKNLKMPFIGEVRKLTTNCFLSL